VPAGARAPGPGWSASGQVGADDRNWRAFVSPPAGATAQPPTPVAWWRRCRNDRDYQMAKDRHDASP